MIGALIVANKLPLYDADRIDHTGAAPNAPAIGPTVEYGRYLTQVAGCTGCTGCHGETLAGGKIPQADPV